MASVSLHEVTVRNIDEDIAVKQAILSNSELVATIAKVGQEMIDALKRGRKILFFGNGGSAADAQHLAAELVGRFERERHSLPAIALTANTSSLTAIANDYGYEHVFARQVEALSVPGDVAVGISTSGRSPNVIGAVRAAKNKEVVTVVMTGRKRSELASSADYCICVPSERTARIQEAHILIGHVLCEMIEVGLFSSDHAS